LAFKIEPTMGLIVYLYSIKHAKNLKQFGRLYYVSKRMRYALLYIDQDRQTEVIKKLNSENYVKQVVPSHLNELVHEVEGKNTLDEDDSFDEDF
jgi:uncharacterized protein YlbG (UPF0298 family)